MHCYCPTNRKRVAKLLLSITRTYMRLIFGLFSICHQLVELKGFVIICKVPYRPKQREKFQVISVYPWLLVWGPSHALNWPVNRLGLSYVFAGHLDPIY